MAVAGDLLPLVILVLLGALYEQRAAILAHKGHRVPRRRRALVWTGLGLLAVADAPPLHEGAETLLMLHMLQHVLLGDLAPLALALALSGAVLRPVLAIRVVRPVRRLAHPLVALPLWAGTLLAWHIPAVYDAAVESEWLHLLEHASFFLAGLAMWFAVVETLPGPAWFGARAKLAYVVGLRAVTLALGNALFWAGGPLYPHYAGAGGLTALEDQQLAAVVMMAEATLVTLVFICVLFLRALADSEREQALVEQGVDERAAARAVRYGRDAALGGRTPAR